MVHSMQVSIEQLRVCSHQLRIELDHHILQEQWICLFCSLGEGKTSYHLIFRWLIYYKIRGRFHCFFRGDSHSLSTFFSYKDQCCFYGALVQTPLTLHIIDLSPTTSLAQIDQGENPILIRNDKHQTISTSARSLDITLIDIWDFSPMMDRDRLLTCSVVIHRLENST